MAILASPWLAERPARALRRRRSMLVAFLGIYVALLALSIVTSQDPRESYRSLSEVVTLAAFPVALLSVSGERRLRWIFDTPRWWWRRSRAGRPGPVPRRVRFDRCRIRGPFSHVTFSGVRRHDRPPDRADRRSASGGCGAALARSSVGGLGLPDRHQRRAREHPHPQRLASRTWPASGVGWLLWTRRRSWLLLAPAALFVVVLLAPVPVVARAHLGDEPLGRVDLRPALHAAGQMRMVAEHPLVGLGPNMPERRYPIYRHPTASRLNVPHLHDYLRLAERGLPSWWSSSSSSPSRFGPPGAPSVRIREGRLPTSGSEPSPPSSPFLAAAVFRAQLGRHGGAAHGAPAGGALLSASSRSGPEGGRGRVSAFAGYLEVSLGMSNRPSTFISCRRLSSRKAPRSDALQRARPPGSAATDPRPARRRDLGRAAGRPARRRRRDRMIHGYSLIHDDLPALRRRRPAARSRDAAPRYDEATAILAGMRSLSNLTVLAREPSGLAPEVRARAVSRVGEAIGTAGRSAGRWRTSKPRRAGPRRRRQLDRIHRRKTARTISACANSGVSTRASLRRKS
ncbi:MAG: hypothetical protein R2862_02435 [Thermoanaerobaculia bacterium]